MHHRHFLLHKPKGFLSQFIYTKKRTKKLLGELHEFPDGTMAIGRLDEQSEGLLLLTTDGMASERVRSRKVEKEYAVLVDGIVTDEALSRLSHGVEIGFKGIRYKTLPCSAKRLDAAPAEAADIKIRDPKHGPVCWISIVIAEGKFRQVRKMTAAVGFPTLRLIRTRIGPYRLDGMASGEIIEIPEISI